MDDHPCSEPLVENSDRHNTVDVETVEGEEEAEFITIIIELQEMQYMSLGRCTQQTMLTNWPKESDDNIGEHHDQDEFWFPIRKFDNADRVEEVFMPGKSSGQRVADR